LTISGPGLRVSEHPEEISLSSLAAYCLLQGGSLADRFCWALPWTRYLTRPRQQMARDHEPDAAAAAGDKGRFLGKPNKGMVSALM